MADTILLKGISHGSLPTLLAREPAVAFDPMTGNAQLFIGTPVGNQLVTGAAGAAGPAGPGAVGIVSTAPGPGLTAAKGDGATDDTAALNAMIGAGQFGFVPVLIGTGLYPIATPLLLSRPSALDLSSNTINVQSGFILRGLTSPAFQGLLTNGNMIRMTGTGQDSILQLGKGAVYSSLIENISLDGGAAALGTGNGIHTLYDYWSGLSLVNARIMNVGWDIWIDGALGGGNGEYLNAYNCYFHGRLGCYKNTSPSGQALVHTFTSCHSETDNGGTEFFLNNGQLNVFAWDCTQQPGTLPNVFLRLDETLTGRCNFVGGRCEHVDTLISWLGGSPQQFGTASIEGIDFVGMSGTKAFLSGGGTNCNYRFVIKHCQFITQNPISGALLLAINSGGNEQIVFEDCDFIGWGGGYAQLSGNSHVTLVRCRYQDTSSVMHAL